jgi:predicted GIY-YIG superfamily endonuclease
MPTNIYILKLTSGKYYVGKSDNPMARYQQHLNGNGSAWTKKYKPVSIEKIFPNASDFDEDKYTKEYMSKYGIENVRGGTYVEINLDDFQVESLERELWGAKNKCTQCGREGHFVKDCYARTTVNGNQLVNISDDDSEEEIWECEYCEKEFSDEEDCEEHERYCRSKSKTIKCFKCGREGHYASSCYATKHIKGYYLN